MRRFIAVLSALALVAVVAGPTMAAKPGQSFTTTLTVAQTDGGTAVPAAGSYNGGFFVPTNGDGGWVYLDTTGTVAVPALTEGPYPFYLKAGTAQQAALLAYFTAKWGPGDYLIQMTKQINGTDPFFYLKSDGSIFDGFTSALAGGTVEATLRVDNNYPTGTYLYTGDLNGLKAQVKQKVYRA